MTRIDFYILTETAQNQHLLFTCRLAEKLYLKNHRCYIHTESAEQAEQLDQLLWTFNVNFIPHALYENGGDADVPIQIGHMAEPELSISEQDGVDVLINLTAAVPSFFSRFARLAEIVAFDDTHKQKARERFRFYRDRGYVLESHTI